MKNYYLIIKTGSDDAPDIERDVQAKSKAEAVDIFYKWLKNYGWDKSIIERNVIEESEFIN